MDKKIILALDPISKTDPYKWCIKIIDETQDLVAGYKIGLPLILKLERKELRKISKKIEDVELRIVDLKLADIDTVMIENTKPFIEQGYNIFIAHGFIGLEKGLIELSKHLRKNNSYLVTIISMSHPGSSEIMDKNIDRLIEIARKTNSWGVVVGATKPDIIRYTRNKLDKTKILSPGIGIQGAEPGSAIRNGADYEIIGRLVTGIENPREKLYELLEKYY